MIWREKDWPGQRGPRSWNQLSMIRWEKDWGGGKSEVMADTDVNNRVVDRRRRVKSWVV